MLGSASRCAGVVCWCGVLVWCTGVNCYLSPSPSSPPFPPPMYQPTASNPSPRTHIQKKPPFPRRSLAFSRTTLAISRTSAPAQPESPPSRTSPIILQIPLQTTHPLLGASPHYLVRARHQETKSQTLRTLLSPHHPGFFSCLTDRLFFPKIPPRFLCPAPCIVENQNHPISFHHHPKEKAKCA